MSGATPNISGGAGGAGLRNALLERRRYLDTLKMDEATMERFAADLVRRGRRR